MEVEKLQRKFILGGILWIPFLPFMFLQSRYVRWRVGRLPDAQGANVGEVKGNEEVIKFLAIGESTIAGVGAQTHETALTGQFAKILSLKTGKTCHWLALGESGITVEKTLKTLALQMPEEKQDIVLIALGANDVFYLRTPRRWRKDMSELIQKVRLKYPEAKIFLANVPMIRDMIALPNPLRHFLSRIAKLHHFNILDLTKDLEKVYYYEPQGKFTEEHYSDGVHPSERGYTLWAEAMIEFFERKKAL